MVLWMALSWRDAVQRYKNANIIAQTSCPPSFPHPPAAHPPPGRLASADLKEQTHAALLSDGSPAERSPWVESITGGSSQTALAFTSMGDTMNCPEML